MKSKNLQPKYRGIVVFDLDGVLADFEGAFCEAFGYDNRHLYNLSKRYPDQADTVSEWVNEPVNYQDLAPIFGGILWLNQVIKAGYYVAIVTARNNDLFDVTSEWLDRYNIRPHNVVYTDDKASVLAIMSNQLELPVILFVDDSRSMLEQVSAALPETECVAWSQPWNDGWFPRASYDENGYKVKIKLGE